MVGHQVEQGLTGHLWTRNPSFAAFDALKLQISELLNHDNWLLRKCMDALDVNMKLAHSYIERKYAIFVEARILIKDVNFFKCDHINSQVVDVLELEKKTLNSLVKSLASLDRPLAQHGAGL